MTSKKKSCTTGKIMKIDGYVIVPPVSPWDEKHKESIWLNFSYSNFGLNPAEAWRNFLDRAISDPDVSKAIQEFHDRGYRVKKATLEMYDE